MYKAQGNKGLFDEEFTKDRLSLMGNPLEAIIKVIDFEFFRDSLESKLLNTNKKNNAGAKPYDVVMLFKILILQRYYGLGCLLYTSDAADDLTRVDLGGRRIIK